MFGRFRRNAFRRAEQTNSTSKLVQKTSSAILAEAETHFFRSDGSFMEEVLSGNLAPGLTREHVIFMQQQVTNFTTQVVSSNLIWLSGTWKPNEQSSYFRTAIFISLLIYSDIMVQLPWWIKTWIFGYFFAMSKKWLAHYVWGDIPQTTSFLWVMFSCYDRWNSLVRTVDLNSLPADNDYIPLNMFMSGEVSKPTILPSSVDQEGFWIGKATNILLIIHTKLLTIFFVPLLRDKQRDFRRAPSWKRELFCVCVCASVRLQSCNTSLNLTSMKIYQHLSQTRIYYQASKCQMRDILWLIKTMQG